MRLEWLEDIMAVAETGSFNEAAERRHLTQSAFSRRIKTIESYVGVELFDRAHKPVVLRPTTQDQKQRIIELAQELRQLVTDLRVGDRRSSKRIILASLHALTTSLTPELIERVQAHDPNVYIRLRSANLDDCYNLLLSRQADIALVYRLPGEELPVEAAYVEIEDIGTERLIPVFCCERVVELNAHFAAGELPLIAYPPDVFLGRVMDRVVLPKLRRQAQLMPRAETALTLAALELATVGIGIAWVPSSLARERIADGRLADLSATLPVCELAVCAVRNAGTASPVVDTVWDLLRQATASIG